MSETTAEAPVEEEFTPPVWRYFTVSADIQLATQNEDVSADSVEAAVQEQVTLPTAVWVQNVNVGVTGVTSNGVSEAAEPTEINAGYGRLDPLLGAEALGAPAPSGERTSPPEAVVGETAVIKSGLELGMTPGAQYGDAPATSEELDAMTKSELISYAKRLGLEVNDTMTKAQIRAAIDAA